MSDTVVVMRGGEIQQIGTPEDIYNEPKNAFVADFIGESNILCATMIEDFRVRFLGLEFPCIDRGFGVNAPVDVVLRPEDVKLRSLDTPLDAAAPRGEVISTLFKGVHYEMRVQVGEDVLLVHSTHAREPGTRVQVTVAPADIQVMHKSDRSPDVLKEERARKGAAL